MRRYTLPTLVALAAVALLVLLVYGVANQGSDTSIDAAVSRGERPLAPDALAALPMLGAGRDHRLVDFRGKVVVVNVFASWCDPCKAEAPVLEHAERRIAGRGGMVLGVTYLDNSNDSQSFVRQHGITYPIVRDVNGNFVRSFGTTGVPETFVIDRHGRIAALRRYQVDGKWLDSTIARVLAEKT